MCLAVGEPAIVSWPEPTREMKPWVYNWWMGSAVDETGLEWQCKELSEKGFGGFHVIPIYGAKGYETRWRSYRSPEWMEAFAMAKRIGARHGLGIDLTMGSGWYFGGSWIEKSEGCVKLVLDVCERGANRIREMDRQGVKWKIFTDINMVAIDYKPFDASNWPVQKHGVKGPVRIVER